MKTMVLLNLLILLSISSAKRLFVENHLLSSKLYWVSNTAGLFSQIVQLSIMFDFAKTIDKTLVAVPATSAHYRGQTINMCSILLLPEGIECKRLPPNINCTANFQNKTIWREQKDLCYRGSINFSSQHKTRYLVVRAVDKLFPIQFRDINQNILDKVKTSLGVTNGKPYTVVHWRRGDQLTTRCRTGFDVSVNCEDAISLITNIKSSSNDSLAYIATNEPQESVQMQLLRNAGFLTFTDIESNITAALQTTEYSKSHNLLSTLQILALEASLMLDCTTFLGWGISEINDIIEHERMRANCKSYCSNQHKTNRSLSIATQPETWCGLHTTFELKSL